MIFLIIIIILLILVISLSIKYLIKAREVHIENSIYNDRKTCMYNLAKQRSIYTKKPLMVIGDPKNGSYLNRTYNYPVYGTPYGYGDLCIDLSGCPENTGHSLKTKLEDIIDKFNTNSYVIFISQTLEYLDPTVLENTLKHLIRVSNKDLFIVNMNFDADIYKDRFDSFTSNTYFTKVPPINDIIEYYYLNNKNILYSIDLKNCDINNIQIINKII
jgi:hypothetical protein